VGAVNLLVPYTLAAAGTSASTTGFVLLTLSAAMAATSPPAGLLADRVGAAPVVFAGTLVVFGGAGWLLAAPTSPLGLLGPLLLIGVGNGLFAGPNAALLLDATPAQQRGASSGLAALGRTLGFTLGPALATLALGTGGATAGAGTLLTLATFALLASATMALTPAPRHAQ
jgi:MFS family permease